MKIIISSAVTSEEKEAVKEKLYEMASNNLIKIEDKIYDCADTPCFWEKKAKQVEIYETISEADWFVCLVTGSEIGYYTWKEMEFVINEKLKGSPVRISVFHPNSIHNETDKKPESIEKNKPLSWNLFCKEAGELLVNSAEQELYWNAYVADAENKGICSAVESELLKAIKMNAFPFQHIDFFVQEGKSVSAKQFFFETINCNNTYIYRDSVDGDLKHLCKDTTFSFIFITGKPVSGKSRALYEFLRSELKDKRVVVMNRENIIKICNNLSASLAQRKHWFNNFASKDVEENIYFVCDQIDDVLSKVPQEMKTVFLDTINEHDNYKLIATGTKNSIENFINNSNETNGIIVRNYQIINIPLISNDPDRKDILSKLRYIYKAKEGEVVGDFIPGLKEATMKVAGEIVNECRTNIFLRKFIQSLQITLLYRREKALLLPICISHSFLSDAEFKDGIIASLKFLSEKNFIIIYDNENKGKKIPDLWKLNNELSSNDPRSNVTIDNEEFPGWIGGDYYFKINELLWQIIEEFTYKPTDEPLLYDLFDKKQLINAMNVYWKSYPHASTLRRLISRIPKRQTPDKDGDEKRLRMTWDFVFDKIKNNLKVENENINEMRMASNCLIGRAANIDEVKDVLAFMERNNITLDNSSIGEMCCFAVKRLQHSDGFHAFVEKIEELDHALQKQEVQREAIWTYEDFYRVSWKIKLYSNEYQHAYMFVKEALDKLHYEDADDRVFEAGDAVKQIFSKRNSFEQRNLKMMMVDLSLLCKTKDDVLQLLNIYIDYQMLPSASVVHNICHVVHDAETVLKIMDMLFKEKETITNYFQEYEEIIVNFVPYMNSFGDSVRLYERWRKDIKDNVNGTRPNLRFVSLCLKNCKKEEFQSAIGYIHKELGDKANGIIYNILISLAPNSEDALYLLNKMKETDVDEYTLSNCLNVVIKSSKSDKSDEREYQNFLIAYEFINHPKLRVFAKNPSCLQKIYELAYDKGQDIYIYKTICCENKNFIWDNDFINSTLIMKRYRTFSDAFNDVYEKALLEFRRKTGDQRPELFNSMCTKYFNDKCLTNQEPPEESVVKLKENIAQIIEDGVPRLIQDEIFILNYHFKLLGEKLFDWDNKEMSRKFIEFFKGKNGSNFNPKNLMAINRYIKYIRHLPGQSDSETQWQMIITLYDFYKNYYEENRLKFKPDASIYVSMMNHIENCPDEKKAEHIKFIDGELCRYAVKNTDALNAILNKWKKKYEINYPTTGHNIYVAFIKKIRESHSSEDVLNIIKEEIENDGFITPSLLNCALEQYRNFQRNHHKTVNDFVKRSKEKPGSNPRYININDLVNAYPSACLSPEVKLLFTHIKSMYVGAKDWIEFRKEINNACEKFEEKQLSDLLQVLTDHQLSDSLTIRGKTLVALLEKDDDRRKIHMQDIESMQGINEVSFGMLASDMTIAKFDINLSRSYYDKWLQIYKDIYRDDDNKWQFQYLPEQKWNTIGQHLRIEIEELYRQKMSGQQHKLSIAGLYDHLKKKDNKLEVLERIDDIIKMFKMANKEIKEANFERIRREDLEALLDIFHKEP